MFTVHELAAACSGKLTGNKKNSGLKGICLDTRILKPGEAFIAIKGENFDGHEFIGQAIEKGARCVIKVSSIKCSRRPSVNIFGGRDPDQAKRASGPVSSKIAVIEVKDTVQALGDIARYNRQKYNIPVIAVTGSNGKTTTKDMIAWVLGKDFKVLKNEGTKNNHIGLPQALLGLDKSHTAAVLELGTNHSGEIDYLAGIAQPTIAVITNIGPSHLEHFKNLAGVCKEKTALFTHLRKPSIALINADDPFLRKFLSEQLNIFSAGVDNAADFHAGCVKVSSGITKFRVNLKQSLQISTLGGFNVYNALMAIAAARLLGMDYAHIANRLKSFKFSLNRLNLVEIQEARFLNDTYNANPSSVGRALEAVRGIRVAGRKILVLGDMLELGESGEQFHREAGVRAASICDCLIFVGELSLHAAEAAREAGFDLRHLFTCENSAQARQILFDRIIPGREDLVLVKGSRAMKMEEVLKI